jgi:hypothetical protein
MAVVSQSPRVSPGWVTVKMGLDAKEVAFDLLAMFLENITVWIFNKNSPDSILDYIGRCL